ncbi:ABC transporter substrate-binding protein [Nitrososphaera sp. AFS]|jgi:NitT/TauT family transport system substrate-binding protein|uniref:ABC transporter substrate-binding protein n=1 Tax=Nitrososphaera sp. AFS TaxID=2301191 RepID=UPI00139221B9|nr:ABC transporter substrate-binding protein [Nitrososphaera sp. AFS]NAL78312.1 aliphatic sulfonate ABC transporter substrate-binding protein [Nitrososphaera sp. AFS]
MDNYTTKKLTIATIGIILAAMIFLHSPVVGYAQTSGTTKILRVGYFPNVNHAQAVIGFGTGEFQKELGSNIQVQPYIFNAGSSAIQALLANRVDVTYVGPGPAVNGYVASQGNGLRVISGAASGGVVFVVRNDSGIKSPKDFANKVFASPQLGNTQDIALRNYLHSKGYQTKDNGGNVTVTPVDNPTILTLFLKKQIDGAWVPEPWGARLVNEAGGKILVDESTLWPPDGKFVTTNIVARTDYLQQNPDVVKKLLAANVNETLWINNHTDDAIKLFNTEFQKLTGKTIKENELKQAWSRIQFTYDPLKLSLFQQANNAYDIGFLAKGKPRPDVSGIYDLTLLNQVLKEKGLQTIESGGIGTGTGTSKGGLAEAIP